MQTEQGNPPGAPLERYVALINKAFEPYQYVSPDLLEDTQRSQLFLDGVDRSLGKISERYRRVLDLRFGLTDGNIHSLHRTGENIPNMVTEGKGITSQRVKEIEFIALKQLRHPSRSWELRHFLVQTTDDKDIEVY